MIQSPNSLPALLAVLAAALGFCPAVWGQTTSPTLASQPAIENAKPVPLAGIFERAGALNALAPDRLANPILAGDVLEAEWADLERQPGVYDFRYFERSLALTAIAGKRVAIILGGAYPAWAAPQTKTGSPSSIDSAWRRFVLAFAKQFSESSSIVMVAIAKPGLPRAEWTPADLAAPSALPAAAILFAQAFPDCPLAFYVGLPSGPQGGIQVAAALRDLLKAVQSPLVIVPAAIQGEKSALEACRPAGEVIRAARGTVLCGIDLARHTPRPDENTASENENPQLENQTSEIKSPESQPEPDPPAEQFRRALAFGLWLGASYFEIDATDAASLAARPDLLELHTRLARLHGLSPLFPGLAPPPDARNSPQP